MPSCGYLLALEEGPSGGGGAISLPTIKGLAGRPGNRGCDLDLYLYLSFLPPDLQDAEVRPGKRREGAYLEAKLILCFFSTSTAGRNQWVGKAAMATELGPMHSLIVRLMCEPVIQR